MRAQNSRRNPLRGDAIVKKFPGGIKVPCYTVGGENFIAFHRMRRPLMVKDLKFGRTYWWVDILSLFNETANDLVIRFKYEGYPLYAGQRVRRP